VLDPGGGDALRAVLAAGAGAGGGIGGLRRVVQGDGAGLPGGGAVAGILAAIGVIGLVGHALAHKARVVALVVIGPVAGIVAEIHAVDDQIAGLRHEHFQFLGIPGGAAVAGIMADILVQQHGAGHAGAGKALVVAFAVAG